MFRTAVATAALIIAAMAVQADVSIGTDVITTGTEIKVLGPGPDLQAIINGIVTDRIAAGTPDKPYLIKLGPGVYPITADGTTGLGLVMEPFISIMGSGQEVTILKGAISSGSFSATSAIVIGASNVSLTDLSVENTGSPDASIAVYNENASPHIRNVTATASGPALGNVGVFNRSNSNPVMSYVTATASGLAVENTAVINTSGSSPTMSHVTATASGATTTNIGLQASGSTQVDSSTLSGTTAGVNIVSTAVRITNTRIVGGVTDAGMTQCLNTYDEDLVDVSC